MFYDLFWRKRLLLLFTHIVLLYQNPEKKEVDSSHKKITTSLYIITVVKPSPPKTLRRLWKQPEELDGVDSGVP